MVEIIKEEMNPNTVYVGGTVLERPHIWQIAVLDENGDKVMLTYASLLENERKANELLESIGRKVVKITHEVVLTRNDIEEYRFTTTDDFFAFIESHANEDNLQEIIFCWIFLLVYNEARNIKIPRKDFCPWVFAKILTSIKETFDIQPNERLKKYDYIKAPLTPPYPYP
ncbi:MAG: hypothetical protein MJ188_07885 [Treponema sp.]|nr:hypothetical protein [Treponema sp.]